MAFGEEVLRRANHYALLFPGHAQFWERGCVFFHPALPRWKSPLLRADFFVKSNAPLEISISRKSAWHSRIEYRFKEMHEESQLALLVPASKLRPFGPQKARPSGLHLSVTMHNQERTNRPLYGLFGFVEALFEGANGEVGLLFVNEQRR